jgi:hypothetical protein
MDVGRVRRLIASKPELHLREVPVGDGVEQSNVFGRITVFVEANIVVRAEAG